MTTLDSQIRQVKRETERMLRRINRELNRKFGEKEKTSYRVTHSEGSHTRAAKATAKVRSQQGGSLSRFRMSVHNRLKVQSEEPMQPQPKAHAQCLCTHRTIDGKRWSVMSPDCPEHGTFKENLSFSQGKEKAPMQRRKGVTSY